MTGGGRRVLVLGATGTIGRALVPVLAARGHEVVCVARRAGRSARSEVRIADVTDAAGLIRDGGRGERFDAVMSCLAARDGTRQAAWAVDCGANVNAIGLARAVGAAQMVLLSAICVQRPRLEFQHAKLAAESALQRSGLAYSIVRPTAFFKSLSGQIERVRRGRPFLLFGDGRRTACKPIGDGDLARYLADCLEDRALRNRVLPIGGPGPAITPRAQGEHLFGLLGVRPRFRSVPVGLLDAVAGGLGLAARVRPSLAAKAELARIGRYYATESMLVLDEATGRYDADATPQTGTDTLFAHYSRVLAGEEAVERGAHSVF